MNRVQVLPLVLEGLVGLGAILLWMGLRRFARTHRIKERDPRDIQRIGIEAVSGALPWVAALALVAMIMTVTVGK